MHEALNYKVLQSSMEASQTHLDSIGALKQSKPREEDPARMTSGEQAAR